MTFAVLGGILVLHYTRIAAPIEDIFLRVIQPLQTRLYHASVTTTAADTADVSTLSREQLIQHIDALTAAQNNASVKIAQLQMLVDDAHLLESQLAFLKERSFSAVNARVTSRSTEQLSQSVIINRGSANGLQVGLPVITGEGVLVGTVHSVSEHTAEVLLTTSYDSRVSGRIQNDAQSPGVVRGEHNLSLLMEYIPEVDVVSVGETVVTNGADPFIPQGLVVGRVQEVLNAQGDLFQQASVVPLYTSADVFIVSVLLP